MALNYGFRSSRLVYDALLLQGSAPARRSGNTFRQPKMQHLRELEKGFGLLQDKQFLQQMENKQLK
ncbi:hypothetical protein LTR22_025695 [Elasticomyces elasticus]|nr:hypothetical protein LTR22_025695 [Elasticomyces elasticus]KAK4905563.1 hypothetical protein LTR49_025161 [Elasticomyces elasticus]